MSNEELAERIKNGETELMITLWKQVEKLVRQIVVRRYLPRNGSTNRVELDDLLQAGFIGMVKAINAFDSTSGFQFTTFLDKHLSNEARQLLGIRGKKRDSILYAISMDKPMSTGEESDQTLLDTLEDKALTYTYEDMIDGVDKQADIQAIFNQVKQLTEIEQEIFEERFLEGLTVKEIANNHGFNQERVRSTINRSISKIRRSKTIRLMSREQYVDRNTNFYARKGLQGFKTSFSSVVEDSVVLREIIRNKFGDLAYNAVFKTT